MYNFPMTYIGIPFSQFPKQIVNKKFKEKLSVLYQFVSEDLQLDRAEMYLKEYNNDNIDDCIQDPWCEKFVSQLIKSRDLLLSKGFDFIQNYSGEGDSPSIFGCYVYGEFGETHYPTDKQMIEFQKDLEEFKTLMKNIFSEDIYNDLIENKAILLSINTHTT